MCHQYIRMIEDYLNASFIYNCYVFQIPILTDNTNNILDKQDILIKQNNM